MSVSYSGPLLGLVVGLLCVVLSVGAALLVVVHLIREGQPEDEEYPS